MGRSKKTVVEIENLEPELEEAMEAEALETASEETEAEEEVALEKPARKPRARKPRKQAEPKSLLGAMSKPVEAEKEEEEVEKEELDLKVESESEEVIEEKKPAPRRKRATNAEKAAEADVEEIAKPWAAVKDISVTISSHLEKVNQQLREIPQQELFRPPVAKPAAITKVAVGMSFFAIVLSVVSLLLSQQARQVALEQIASPAAVVQSLPTAPGGPQQLALETIRRKPQRAKKTR